MGLPVSEDRIAAAELELGFKFPPALRQRIASNNGGEILADGGAWSLHPVWDPTDRKTASRSANHLVRETRSAREWSGFPANAVAIASDGSGDLLVLVPGDDSLKLWLHESAEIVDVEVNFSASGAVEG